MLGIHGDHVHSEGHISITKTIDSEAVDLGNSSIIDDDNSHELEKDHEEVRKLLSFFAKKLRKHEFKVSHL